MRTRICARAYAPLPAFYALPLKGRYNMASEKAGKDGFHYENK
jgi:hypothetical protein